MFFFHVKKSECANWEKHICPLSCDPADIKVMWQLFTLTASLWFSKSNMAGNKKNNRRVLKSEETRIVFGLINETNLKKNDGNVASDQS